MARAATKKGAQRAKATPAAQPRRNGRSGPKPIEQTLFFTRLRRQAKWAFILLVFVFAGGFVFFGVGSGSTGIGDLFNGKIPFIGSKTASTSPSISKAQKRIQKNPKDAAAYRDLARAYELKHEDVSAISTLETYSKLRPRDADGLRELAGLYASRAQKLSVAAQAAQAEAQAAQPTNLGPAPNSKLGKALGAGSNPISSAASQAANERFNAIYSTLLSTLTSQENVYARLVKAAPGDAASLLLYAQTATYARDYKTAVNAYETFVKKFPQDPSVPYAKQQLKTLKPLATAAVQQPPTG
jgi:hypothetical protein